MLDRKKNERGEGHGKPLTTQQIIDGLTERDEYKSRCAELEAKCLKIEGNNMIKDERIRRLEAENAALRERIETHNQECRALCMGRDCPTYRPEKDRCCDCSKDWLLHIGDLAAPHQPAQSEDKDKGA